MQQIFQWLYIHNYKPRTEFFGNENIISVDDYDFIKRVVNKNLTVWRCIKRGTPFSEFKTAKDLLKLVKQVCPAKNKEVKNE